MIMIHIKIVKNSFNFIRVIHPFIITPQKYDKEYIKRAKSNTKLVHSVPPVELQAFQPNLPSPHHLSRTFHPRQCHYSFPTDKNIFNKSPKRK